MIYVPIFSSDHTEIIEDLCQIKAVIISKLFENHLIHILQHFSIIANNDYDMIYSDYDFMTIIGKLNLVPTLMYLWRDDEVNSLTQG